jgi:hypothetical protein
MTRQSEAEFQALVDTLTEARRHFERAQGEFFCLLLNAELHHLELILDNGCGSFDGFLRQHRLTKPSYYRDWRSGRERVAAALPERDINEVVVSIGASAVVKISQGTDVSKVSDFVEAVELTKEERGGIQPKNLGKLAVDTGLDAPRSKVLAERQKMSQLQGRLEQTQAKLRAAEAEIRRLKLRVAELEEQLVVPIKQAPAAE